MEPWLDSLSEDWNSQPPSSPPASLPKHTPNASLRSFANSPRSRIPRLRSTSKLSGSALSSSPHIGQSTSLKRRRILSEKSSSEVNLPRQTTKPQDNDKIPLTSRLSRSSSTSSVVRAAETGTQQRKSRSNSPPKSNAQSKNRTPEWKRLVMGEGFGNTPKNDLFAPIGLEGIFVKPPDDPAGSSPKTPNDSSLLQRPESLPSSPPPWPSNYPPPQTKTANSNRWASCKTLEAVAEQDEETQNNPPEHSSDTDSVLRAPTKTHIGENTEAHHLDSLADSSKKILRQGANQQIADDLASSHCEMDAKSARAPTSSSVLGLAKTDSSVSDGLSPVFISKHHTVDGRVDYAALDMSNPEMVMQMKQMSLQNDSGNRSASWQTAIKDSVTEDIPITPEQQKTALLDDCAQISGFVSVQRGGHSDEDSFKRRPLSPSVPQSDLLSDSLAPSDSASQVATGTSNECANAENELSRSDHTKQRTSVQTTAPADDSRTDSVFPLEIGLSSSPLKLFANHDTFTNNQLLRRIGQLDLSALRTIRRAQTTEDPEDGLTALENRQPMENLSSVFTQQFNDTKDGTSEEKAFFLVNGLGLKTHGSGYGDVNAPPLVEQDNTQSKRSPPTPIAQSVPKRQRTLCRLDEIPPVEPRASGMDERAHQIPSLIGKKRKDARYDGNSETCKPDELAKREILRPRNLTSVQFQDGMVHTDEVQESFITNESCLSMIEQHLEKLRAPTTGDDADAIKALASDVNNFYINASRDFNGSVRKQSVSTQDYVVEAMKLMEIIRSTRKPQSELSTFQESVIEGLTPQTISRPPSRDGPAFAWRDQNREPLPAQVLQRLDQYREAGEESFTVSSAIEPFELSQEDSIQDEPQDIMESEMRNVRIFGSSAIEEPAVDNIETKGSDERSAHEQVKSQSSQGSTGSTGRTIQTNSSQKIRNVATIAPDKVSHLIQCEQAGMRFDMEQRKWIRCKSVHTSDKLAKHISSSTGTEDDPFENIPDLNVDGFEKTYHPLLDAKKSEHSQIDVDEDHDELVRQVCNSSDDMSLLETGRRCDPETADLKDNACSLDFNQVLVEKRKIQQQNREDSSVINLEAMNENGVPPSSTPLSKAPSGSIRSKHELPEHSNSPYASERSLNFSGSTQLALQHNRNWDSSNSKHATQQPPAQVRAMNDGNEYRHGLSLSCIDEHQEISFTQVRPDGRTFSLTLSMSTPIPSSDRRISFAPSSALRSGRPFQPLSPLSEFTLHQDDYSHLERRNLLGGNNALQIRGNYVQTSLTVSKLVDKLIEAHKDDGDWDAINELSLQEENLDNLLMLEDFCPRIEELDVSRNELRHMDGIPSTVRQLNVKQNLLSSLTNWSHLINLQYLNVSGNEIDSLEALSCLVHLRELRADDNAIMDLQGLLDLKGLLHLSLRRNQLQCVGFLGANLSQLVTIDLCENSIEDLEGLSDVPCLEELYLSNNFMKRFYSTNDRTSGAARLRTLCVDSNLLEELDVSCFPNLQILVADNNSLQRVSGIAKLEHMETVCLRSQKMPSNSVGVGEYLNDFAEVRHLYLSDNRIPFLRMATSFLNLQTLEIAVTGLRYLPANLCTLAPNLRTLNVNFNALSDLRPLKGIQRLTTLLAAGNRIKRLRYTTVVVNKFPELKELDLRGNMFCAGFFPPVSLDISTDRSLVQSRVTKFKALPQQEVDLKMLQHGLPLGNRKLDSNYVEKLDDNTRQRRKVYELLLATRCENLKKVDGLHFELQQILKRDSVWEQLTSAGFIEKRCEEPVAC